MYWTLSNQGINLKVSVIGQSYSNPLSILTAKKIQTYVTAYSKADGTVARWTLQSSTGVIWLQCFVHILAGWNEDKKIPINYSERSS